MATPPRLRFGVFEADTANAELRRNGIPLKIREQSFRILVYLLEHSGELVTREDLRRVLWPSDTYVDFEHSLNTAIMKLRDVLGDSADAPLYIETIPRRGYRFVAPVAQVADTKASAAEIAQIAEPASQSDKRGVLPISAQGSVVQRPLATTALTQEPAAVAEIIPLPFLRNGLLPAFLPPARRRAAVLLGLAALAVFALGFAAWHWWVAGARAPSGGADSDHNYAAVRVTPLTTLPGTEFSPTFSPDGSQVAFAWDGGNPDKTDPYDLYVKVIGSEHVEQITHHSAEWIVSAWSPDGRNVAFARKGPGITGIFMVSALGGPERKLVDVSFPFVLPMSLSWSPDGQSLAFANGNDMSTVSTVDGTVHPLPRQPTCTQTFTPAFSPDGQWIAFSCYLDQNYDLEIMPASGGAAKKLIRVNDIPLLLAWSTDSRRILYTEFNRLFIVDREGGRAEQLAFAYSAYQPAVAQRGDRLAYAEWTRNVNLWRMDLVPATAGATSPITTTSREQRAPDISPDGKKIAFESERSGRHDVWVSNLDGSEATEMGRFKSLAGTPRWSPDGRYIVFDSRETGRASLYLVNPQEGVPRRIDMGDFPAEIPRWSRDGRWIYFSAVSTRTNVSALFKIRPEGGRQQLVVSTPATNAQEDRTGHTLYFMAGEVNAPIHAFDLSTGKERELEGMPTIDTPTDWVLASNGIYFIDSAAKPAAINFYDFATHRVIRRMPLTKPPEFWGGLALAPNETWLAYAQVDRNDSDLMLAEPFR